MLRLRLGGAGPWILLVSITRPLAPAWCGGVWPCATSRRRAPSSSHTGKVSAPEAGQELASQVTLLWLQAPSV